MTEEAPACTAVNCVRNGICRCIYLASGVIADVSNFQSTRLYTMTDVKHICPRAEIFLKVNGECYKLMILSEY